MKRVIHFSPAAAQKKSSPSKITRKKEKILPEQSQSIVIEDKTCPVTPYLPDEIVELIREAVLQTFIDCRDVVSFHVTCKKFHSAYVDAKISTFREHCTRAKKRNAVLHEVSPLACYVVNNVFISIMERRHEILSRILSKLRSCDITTYVNFPRHSIRANYPRFRHNHCFKLFNAQKLDKWQLLNKSKKLNVEASLILASIDLHLRDRLGWRLAIKAIDDQYYHFPFEDEVAATELLIGIAMKDDILPEQTLCLY